MRPGRFPQSVMLCGVRDVRDYQIYSSREGTHVKGGSAFNIKAESLRLGDFSEDEVREALAQHTAERGQALIFRRVTHLDQLAQTLSEERVRRVVLPMLAGSSKDSWAVRDLEYVRDLGR